MDRDLQIMNPLVSTSSNDKWLRELMFEPLLGIDETGKIQPNLAESWTASTDGKAYTFKLRRNVKFHNGREMTAEDVKFSLDYTLDPKNGANGRQRLQLVERAEVVDPQTLRMHLKSPSPGLLPVLTSIQAFSVVPQGSLQEGLKKPATFPPGTGPFRYVEWQPSQRLVLERFPDYWGQKAFLDRIVFRPIEDNTVRFTALRTGDVDFAVRVPLQWISQLAGGEIKGVSYIQVPQGALHRIRFNVASAPFDHRKLRLAVAHGIDKKEIFQAAFLGFAAPVDQKYPRGHLWHFEGVPSPAHDPARAKALLAEAGYKGEPIEIIVDQQATSVSAATAIQSQLKKVGLNVNIQVLEVGAYNTRTRRGDYAFSFTGANFYPDASATYRNDLACEQDAKNRTVNDSGYCDKAMDSLLQKSETELDEKKRRELLREIVTKMNEDLPNLYVGFSSRLFAFRDFVKGFTTIGDGTFIWWGGGLNHTWLDR
jgi:peptide/nickel transport system substrate-binding protein